MADEQDFLAAFQRLNQATQAGAVHFQRFLDQFTLIGLGLDRWDDEMDNCYPNFGQKD